jgi:polyhydroxybutyrate depolymerase
MRFAGVGGAIAAGFIALVLAPVASIQFLGPAPGGRIAVARASDFPAKGSLSTAESRTLTLQGETRRYLIAPVRASGRHPVVIVLHGGARDDKAVWVETSLPTLGRRYGFIVVAPDASMNKHWNDGRGAVGIGEPSTADDVRYLKALIGTIVARDNGDPDAVFMVGVSNGGFMTMRFACEAGRLLHAAGNVISNIPQKQVAHCRIGRPLPWISINGDRDQRVPFDGRAPGAILDGRPQSGLESADRTFAFFADKAGCSSAVRTEMVPNIDPSDGSTAEKRVRGGCTGGTTSTQYGLHNAGHSRPGLWVSPKSARSVGGVNEDIDAGSVIWAHFRQTLRR